MLVLCIIYISTTAASGNEIIMLLLRMHGMHAALPDGCSEMHGDTQHKWIKYKIKIKNSTEPKCSADTHVYIIIVYAECAEQTIYVICRTVGTQRIGEECRRLLYFI